MEHYREFVAEGEQASDAEALFEMANLSPKRTGLPFVVWISPKSGNQHDVRVKVSPGPRAMPSQMASVAIRPHIRVVEGQLSASDLALLATWIELNQDVIVRFWNGEIEYTEDAIAAIRPIK